MRVTFSGCHDLNIDKFKSVDTVITSIVKLLKSTQFSTEILKRQMLGINELREFGMKVWARRTFRSFMFVLFYPQINEITPPVIS